MKSGSGKVLDYDTALVYADGDPQLLSELAEFFLEDYPRLIGDARTAIGNGDYFGLERAAHTMKGRLAFFGIYKLRDEILKLELMGRDRNIEGAAEALARFETEMTPVLPEFKSLILEKQS